MDEMLLESRLLLRYWPEEEEEGGGGGGGGMKGGSIGDEGGTTSAGVVAGSGVDVVDVTDRYSTLVAARGGGPADESFDMDSRTG